MSVGDSVRALVGVTLLGVTLFDVFVACDELLDKMLPGKTIIKRSFHQVAVSPNYSLLN
jgi:hypothetical protein